MRERLANAFLEPKPEPLNIENPEDGMRSNGFETTMANANPNVVPLENIFGPDGFESKILPEDGATGNNHRMEFGLFDDDFEDYNEPMSDESFAESSEEEDQSTATARADETTYVSLEENERFVSTHSKFHLRDSPELRI